MKVESEPRKAVPRAPERRQVTALSYDLVGSTRLAVQLDPEDLRALQRKFHEACGEAIQRYKGHVGHFTGDGAMAFFGYPRAHEDDPERAVRAGLAILGNCRLLGEGGGVSGAEISVRVGIATGLVVAGSYVDDPSPDEDDVVGFAPNLAFKLQASASPNTVVVSSTTRELTAGLFQCRARPALAIAGFDKPQPAWQVVRARTRLTRSWNARLQSITPLVARERELDLLQRCWRRADSGHGQVALLKGEPGIGKSRIASAMKDHVSQRPHFTIALQCSSRGTNTAFYPLIHLLERIAGSRSASEADIARRLSAMLGGSDRHAAEAARYFARLLDRQGERPAPTPDPSPEETKARTMAVAVELMEQLSRHRPVLLICEDLHWIDPTSDELLERMIERTPDLRLMLIATCRPGYDAPWIGRVGVTVLELDRLSAEDSAAMVGYLARGREASRSIVDRIVALADGVPLFVEELSRTTFGAGTAKLTAAAGEQAMRTGEPSIPATLSDSLAARLDQLESGREIAQICSVIGRSSRASLVRKVANRDMKSVARALDGLVSAGLAYRHGRPPDAIYTFRHALIQESAYQSMLRSTRQAVHRHLADILIGEYASTSDAAPEIVGHHLEEAGAAAEAIPHFHEAARNAAARSANVEAVRLLERAARLLEAVPPGERRDEQELSLLVSLGPPMLTLNGPGSPEVQTVYARAVDLCSRLPYSREHFAAHWGWWFTARDNREALDRANRLSTLTDKLYDDELALQAHHCQWATQYCLADHRRTEEHIARGLEIYERGDFHHQGTLYGGHDPKSCALGERAMSQWLTGGYERSLISIEQAVTHADELGHKGSIRHSRDQQIMLHHFRGDAARVRHLAEEMATYAAEQGFKGLAVQAKVFKAWATAVLGNGPAGVQLMSEGLEEHMEVNTPEDLPIYYEMAAEAHAAAGEPAKGLPLLDEAMIIAERTGILMWSAELYRRKGLLMLLSDLDRAGALACIRKAVEVATNQGASALRLRALCDLVRHAEAGEGERARVELEALLGSLREGGEYKDVVEARRLLSSTA